MGYLEEARENHVKKKVEEGESSVVRDSYLSFLIRRCCIELECARLGLVLWWTRNW